MLLTQIFLPQIHAPLTPNVQEREFLRLMLEHPQQKRERSSIVYSLELSAVARRHSCDMGHRRYFDHINPEGIGPNRRVILAGIDLPSFYSPDIRANNIESLAGGYQTADETLRGLLESPDHERHILGLTPFYERQIVVGIGYCEVANTKHIHYWTILSYELEN
jgi:uncharacterized protein YkwD